MTISNESSEKTAVDFRPLTQRDFSLLHRWFNMPHVHPWFGGPRSLDAVIEEYSEYLDPDQPIHVYIVELEGRAIGMMNWERFGDMPEFQKQYEVEDPDSSNCDILIGEIDVAHRGLGVTILREFLKRIIFADPRITSCVIDPVPENAIAIRMYEKAGFQFVRALPEDGEGNGLYLLELSRADLFTPPANHAPFYVRPARVEEVPIAVAIDDDACAAYAEIGLTMEMAADHPFVLRERSRWTAAASDQRLLFACSPAGEPIGFIALDFVDGHPHIDQVSVRRAWMKRGIGRALVERAKAWSVRPGELWLTTYVEGIPWNAPWYERLGFVLENESVLGPELAARLAEERSILPSGQNRGAMAFRHRKNV